MLRHTELRSSSPSIIEVFIHEYLLAYYPMPVSVHLPSLTIGVPISSRKLSNIKLSALKVILSSYIYSHPAHSELWKTYARFQVLNITLRTIQETWTHVNVSVDVEAGCTSWIRDSSFGLRPNSLGEDDGQSGSESNPKKSYNLVIQ